MLECLSKLGDCRVAEMTMPEKKRVPCGGQRSKGGKKFIFYKFIDAFIIFMASTSPLSSHQVLKET